ncbi:MAG: hypothetical protein KAS63_02850 [Candidatus Heimdallarchaeota archaeon]|nr:hypothetical protein [Candidatus Heimdallarchaeota archaeon]MCK4954274.1 hypothetical protein [Candidatus Heimdallarchaeota archaeon]
MKEEEVSKKEKMSFKRHFRIQLKKYWLYTRKWFPFSILVGGICGVLMSLFTSLVVNLQVWINFLPVYAKYYAFYPIVGGVTSLLLYFGFKEVKGAGLSHVLSHKNTTTPLKPRTLLTKLQSKRQITIEEIQDDI